MCGCGVGWERLKQMWDSHNRNGGTKIWRNGEIELLTGFVLLNLAFLFHKVDWKMHAYKCKTHKKKDSNKRFLVNEIHFIALQ